MEDIVIVGKEATLFEIPEEGTWRLVIWDLDTRGIRDIKEQSCRMYPCEHFTEEMTTRFTRIWCELAAEYMDTKKIEWTLPTDLFRDKHGKPLWHVMRLKKVNTDEDMRKRMRSRMGMG